MDKLNSA